MAPWFSIQRNQVGNERITTSAKNQPEVLVKFGLNEKKTSALK